MAEDHITLTQWAGIGSLWLIFSIALYRAYSRHRLHTRQSKRIWILFFLWTIAFSLWGDAAELTVNHIFGGLPVGLYVKCVCMMLTFHGYSQILKPMRSDAKGYRLLDRLTPAVLLLILLSYVLYIRNPSIPYETLRYLVIGARDTVMGLLAVFIFIPYTLRLWRHETNPPLKLKQLSALICFVCFTVVAIGGISASILTLFQHPGASQVVDVPLPFVFAGFIAFLITLIPYRWLAWCFLLPRWLVYRRLYRLERFVIGHVDGKVTERQPMYKLRRVDELELAIYRTVISILDQYPLLRSSAPTPSLYNRIQQATRPENDYPELIRTLASMRLE